MPIDALEMKLFRSAVISDAGANGGRLGVSEVVSGIAANLFPVTSQAERLAGSLKYRKAFWKNTNLGNLTCFSPKIFMDYPTPGADIITFFAASQIDTQATIAGTEAQYGVGTLNAGVLAGVSIIDVLVEQAATVIFRNGDLIRISDKVDVNSVGGNEEFVLINGVPTIVGNVVTLTLGTALAHAYANPNTRVSSVYSPADIKTSISDFLATTAGSGDYDPAQLTGDNVGSIEQTWTATFTSAVAFNVVGDTVGAVGGGTVGAGITPNNPAWTRPYFTLAAAGFSGVWAAADTIVFKTHPAAAPLFFKRNVPAASGALAPNNAITALIGETA